MIGQIQVLDIPDMDAAVAALEAHRAELLELANCCDELIIRLGGGSRDVQFRVFPETSVGPMLIFHLCYLMCVMPWAPIPSIPPWKPWPRA